MLRHCLPLAAILALTACAQLRSTVLETIVSIARPDRVEPAESRIAQLKLPAGFTIEPAAMGLGDPRMLAVAADGTVYVSQPKAKTITALNDRDGDGRYEQRRIVARDLALVHGLALHSSALYIATERQVLRAPVQPDGTLGPQQVVVGDLSKGGQHGKRVLKVGPDGMLYVSIGSTCNACREEDAEHATLLRVDPATGRREVFARGLRNLIGFGWQPQTGALWGFDHGTDLRGDNQPPEELNRIQAGGNYGWPYCFGDRRIDEEMSAPPQGTKAEYCARTEPMALGYTAHAAPMGLLFYAGRQFPEDLRGDALAAMQGSWNRDPPSGYEVVRVRFENGQPQRIEPFLTGFLSADGKSHFGRPCDLALAPDGSVLLSDDAGGVLYRISYRAP